MLGACRAWPQSLQNLRIARSLRLADQACHAAKREAAELRVWGGQKRITHLTCSASALADFLQCCYEYLLGEPLPDRQLSDLASKRLKKPPARKSALLHLLQGSWRESLFLGARCGSLRQPDVLLKQLACHQVLAGRVGLPRLFSVGPRQHGGVEHCNVAPC